MILKDTGTIPVAAIPVASLSEELRLGHGFTDDGAEDALLERLLRQAIAVVERRCGLALIRRSFELEVSEWDRRGHLVLPTGPVDDLIGFELRLDDVTTVLTPSVWQVSKGETRQKVTGYCGGALPMLIGDLTARLTFEAGFGPDWADVPEDLARAVLLLASNYYEMRSGDTPVPAGVLALVDLRRPVRL